MSFRPLGTSYPNHTICLDQYETLTHSTFTRQTPGSPRARLRAGGGDSGVSRTGGPALSELVVQWGDRQSGTQRQTDDPAQQCRGGAESSAGGTARVTWAAGRAPPLGAVGTDHPSHGMEGVSPGRWGGAVLLQHFHVWRRGQGQLLCRCGGRGFRGDPGLSAWAVGGRSAR